MYKPAAICEQCRKETRHFLSFGTVRHYHEKRTGIQPYRVIVGGYSSDEEAPSFVQLCAEGTCVGEWFKAQV